MFDLNVDTISLEAGQERKSLPGLWVGAAPRRSARLRGQDRVIFYFSQTGTALVAPNLQQEMLARLAETYFNTDGSVTAGMRVTVERLNDFLLNRNLRGARQGGAVVGALAMAVLHGASLYVLLAGSSHAYLVTATQFEHYQDPNARGLGQARLASQRFFTANLDEAGYLLFAAEPSSEWSEGSLRGWAGLAGHAGEELRHRLVGQALNLSAGVIGCRPGKGEIVWVTPQALETPPAAARTRAEPRPPISSAREPLGAKLAGIFLSGKALKKDEAAPAREATPPARAEVHEPAATASPASETPEAAVAQAPADIQPVDLPAAVSTARPEDVTIQREAPPLRRSLPGEAVGVHEAVPARVPARAETAGVKVQAPPRPQGPSPAAVAAAKAATGVFGGVRSFWKKTGAGFSRLVARAIPGQPEEGLRISPGSMLMIALAVPLAVVAVAATVYFQRGRGEQYQAFLRTAQQFADQAAQQQDLALQREDWNQALFWLDKAAPYGQSDEGTALTQHAQAGLDNMDGIMRLTYLPAGNPMPEGTHITRMVATIN